MRPDEIPAPPHRILASGAVAAPLGWAAGALTRQPAARVALAADGGELRADHAFTLFGLPFLVLRYTIRRKPHAVP